MIVCGLLGLGLAFDVIVDKAPIHFGWVFADAPDPRRPGHLKGVTVSTTELLTQTFLTIALISAAVWFWRKLREMDNLPAA